MNGFDDVVVRYGAEEKKIQSANILRVLAEVEEYITFGLLGKIVTSSGETFQFARLTSAYCVLLKHAGFLFDQKQVLQSIFDGENSENAASGLMSLFSQFTRETEEKKKKPARTKKITS